jgi:hypothetical protein
VTSAPVAVRHLRTRTRVAVAQDAAAIAGLALVFGVLVAVVWGRWGDLDSDTGYDVLAGTRVADGLLPYADFVYYYGPLAPFLSGLAVLLGGGGFGPSIALGLLVTVAIVAATYAVARALLDPLGAFLAAGLTVAVAFVPNNYGFVLPHTHAATLGTLGVLALLLCVRAYAIAGRDRWLVAAGAVAGATALTKPEATAAVFATAGLWLLLRRLHGSRLRRELTLFLAPALAIPALAYGALATAVGPHDLLFENLYPVDMLRAGGNELVSVRMPMTAGSLVELAGYLLLYAGGAAALVLGARVLERRLRRPLAVAVAAAIAVATLAVVVRPDSVREAMYYVYGWLPAGAAIALVVLIRRSRRATEWGATAQLELGLVAAFAVLATTTYGAFVLQGWRPQMAAYYVPFAAIFIARLHLVELARGRAGYALGAAWLAFLVAVAVGLTVDAARDESVTVRGPGGALAETPAEGAAFRAALGEVEARTRPGEPILAAPILTGLYVLADRENPLRELSTLPSALPSPADERAAIARLDAAGVRLAVIDRRDWPGYGQASFGESFDRVLARWLDDNFDRVRTIQAATDRPRVFEIWMRRHS